MSKLFGQKDWLTLPEAVVRLSNTFGEQVTEADVLHFALDGRLKLSILLANRTPMQHGNVVPIESADYREIVLGGKKTVREYSGQIFYQSGKESHVLNLVEGVFYACGVYDLPMIGSEVDEVENLYRKLIGLAETDRRIGDRFYIRALDHSTLAILLECVFDDEEEDPWERHQRLCTAPKIDDYWPTRSLPPGSIFVVRVPLLKEFEDSINSVPATEEIQISRRQRIVEYVNKVKKSGGTKSAAFKSLANTEGCTIDNITRIYYKKDSRK